MNSRGQEQYIMYIVLQIVLLVAAGSILMLFINNVGAETTYHRLFFAEDMGLVVTGLAATSGNVQLEYTSKSLDKFSYKMGEGQIIVEESGKLPVSTVYARDLDVPFLEAGLDTLNPKKLVLTKDGNTLEVRTTPGDLPLQRQCGGDVGQILFVVPKIHKALRDGIESANQDVILTETRVSSDRFQIEVAPRKGPMVIGIPIEQNYEQAYGIACKVANAVSRETGDPVIIKPITLVSYPGLKGKSGFVIEADRLIHNNEVGKAIGRALK